MNSARIELLKQEQAEHPEDPFFAYALGLEFLENEPSTSLKYFEKVYEYFPQYLPNYYQFALLLAEFEQNDKAEELFKNGISLAEQVNDLKALAELRNAFQNFKMNRI